MAARAAHTEGAARQLSIVWRYALGPFHVMVIVMWSRLFSQQSNIEWVTQPRSNSSCPAGRWPYPTLSLVSDGPRPLAELESLNVRVDADELPVWLDLTAAGKWILDRRERAGWVFAL